MAGYAVAVAALFAFYNYRTLDLILPFYNPTNQMFYQEEFMESGEYVDAIIPYLTKGKTIYFPKYMDCARWEEVEDTNERWSDMLTLSLDLKNILIENGANVVFTQDEYAIDINDEEMTRALRSSFDDMGYLNDTFRYSHLYNDIESEYGNGFYYYWAYSKSFRIIKLYVCPCQFEESDELYVILDSDFNVYLVSKQFLIEEVAKY